MIILAMQVALGGCLVEPAPPTPGEPSQTSSKPQNMNGTPSADLSDFAFPTSIDPAARYLFYLHGRIIEDQGLPAVSPEFGEYQYLEILRSLQQRGFIVISEQRPRDTDSPTYASRVVGQIGQLIAAGVPAGQISVVGASKGGGIAVYTSSQLQNRDVNFVIMSICSPESLAEFERSGTTLYGNVLSLYDESDVLAGSCATLFADSPNLARHDEIVLHVGTGHGILYQPLAEWIDPVVDWATGN